MSFTTIKASTVSAEKLFNLDGLEYPKSEYDIRYGNVESTAGVPVSTGIEIGIVNKNTGETLVNPKVYTSWSNDGTTAYASLNALLTDLVVFLGFNTAPGGSGAGTFAGLTDDPEDNAALASALANNSTPWTVIGDGVTDKTSEITTKLSTYGIVTVVGPENTMTSSPITLTDGMHVEGNGTLRNVTGDMFILNGHNITVEGIHTYNNNGHTFNVTLAANTKIDGLKIINNSSGKAAWYQVGSAIAVDNSFVHNEVVHTNSDFPMFHVLVDGDYYNNNSIDKCIFQTNGSPTREIIHLESTNGSAAIYGNSITNTDFEIPDAGAVFAYGTDGLRIINCSAWDVTTTTDDLWKFDNNGLSGLNPKSTVLKNVVRPGGTRGSGFFDINIINHYSNSIIVENCGGSSNVSHNLRSDVLLFGENRTVSAGKNVNTLLGGFVWDGTNFQVNTSTVLSGDKTFNVKGTGFVVRNDDTASKGVRARFGAATDYEFTGGDGVFSVWSGADFTGTQYQFMRAYANGNPTLIARGVLAPSFSLSALNTAPATLTSTGTLGEVRFTTTGTYVCTATNTWIQMVKAPSIIAVTSSRNIASTDIQNTLACTTTATLTITSSFSAMNVGQTINLEAHGTTFTILGGSGVTVNGVSTGSKAIGNGTDYVGGILRKTGTDTYIVL